VWAALIALVVGAAAVVAPAPPAAAAASFTVQPSVRQVAVTGAAPEEPITLHLGGDQVAAGTTDIEGSFLFRQLEPGPGYTVQQGAEESDPVTVMDSTAPPQSLYDGQDIGGYDYIETRDGTTISVNVTLPGAAEDGPYPVVIEYSGYEPSNPTSEGSPTGIAAIASGYAWVGVNIRGTGCSGGAFDYFEELHGLDGYDVVETIATQDWADPTAIGMIGVSYSGISQLFVAPTRPPHLAAITPMSVIADVYRSTLYPGGILNTGFATEWAQGRDDAAQPRASQWVRDRIDGGDTVCEANQRLKLQYNEIIPQLDPAAYYEPERFDHLSPTTLVDDIDIPVLLGGTFQDEQTGGHWPTMIDQLSSADPLKVVMTNGHHVDAIDPVGAVRLLEFFDFYLKREVPTANWLLYVAAPIAFNELFGADDVYLTASRWAGYSDYATALAAYEAEPPITVLWENGAAGADGSSCGAVNQFLPWIPATNPTPCPGRYPYPSTISSHTAWPVPETTTWVQHLGPDGQLLDSTTGLAADEPRAWASYEYAPEDEPQRTYSGSSTDIFRVDATFDWQQPTDHRRASFLTEPVESEVRMLGSGSADLWVRSSAPDVDLEVTISEVTPEGDEVYIQSGWLRASHRALAAGSTQLVPQHSHLAEDAEPLSATEASLARVEIFPFAHILRPGSRLRLTVDAPGGNRPFWEFGSVAAPDGTEIEIAMSDVQPSQLVLPVIGGDAPDDLPPCSWLRGQPCRTFTAPQIPTAVAAAAEGTSVDVTWEPAPGSPDGYEVELLSTGATVEVGAGETAAAFTDVPPGEHRAHVRALVGAEAGPWSSPSLPAVIVAPGPTFIDVPETHEFYDDIEWMAAEGISTGFQPGPQYRPSAKVTRQAMSAFLYRLAGEPAFTPPGTPTFTDVPASSTFFAEIEWMNAEGITTGFPGGLYKPDAGVTRQAMSAFMYRLAGQPPFADPPTSAFGDVATTSQFFTEIEWMNAEGITTGFPGGLYRPQQDVTRQAMSAFLHRLADGPGVDLS
jgi:hypothetical protein